MIERTEVYQIGRIGKSHGVKGEVILHFTDDVFDQTDSDYLILETEGLLVPFFLEEYRFRSNETAIVKFCNIDTQEQARRIVGCTVWFERSKTPQDGEQLLTWKQIAGFTVVNRDTQETVGTITSVDESTINILFEVITAEGRNVLLPANEHLITDIDTEGQTVTMIIPDGLLTLYLLNS